MSRLPPETQGLLRLASVVGQEVELDVLVGVSEHPEAAVLDHLDAALAARLLVERLSGSIERYAFVHAPVGAVRWAAEQPAPTAPPADRRGARGAAARHVWPSSGDAAANGN